MTDVWEPWIPNPGDKVCIRLSAECRRIFPQTHGDALGPTDVILVLQRDWRGHPRELDGVVGEVVTYKNGDFVPHDVADDGHYYPVMFDYVPVNVGDFGRKLLCNLDTFAAIELEPIGAHHD